jgi:coproporphyrinogen III oxidase-like Fe-S oxidoreductase
VTRYLAGITAGDPTAEVTDLDEAALAEDRLWLAMRTSDGAPVDQVPETARARLFAAGLVEVAGDRLRPTPKGLLFADEIAITLLQSRSSAP